LDDLDDYREPARRLAALRETEVEGVVRGYAGYPLGEVVNIALRCTVGEQAEKFPAGSKVRVIPVRPAKEGT
jgi:hypothetical protein